MQKFSVLPQQTDIVSLLRLEELIHLKTQSRSFSSGGITSADIGMMSTLTAGPSGSSEPYKNVHDRSGEPSSLGAWAHNSTCGEVGVICCATGSSVTSGVLGNTFTPARSFPSIRSKPTIGSRSQTPTRTAPDTNEHQMLTEGRGTWITLVLVPTPANWSHGMTG